MDRQRRRRVSDVQGGEHARRETGDVWLDAGIVPFSTLNWLNDRDNWKKWFPAEFITENVEQIRLWYYSQLFFSVVLTGGAPYETVLSHEFVYDENGEEFHRAARTSSISRRRRSARVDIVRWFYMRLNPADKVLFGYSVLSDVKRKLLVLWNTYAFFVTYANLDQFDPSAPVVLVRERPVIDRWLLSSLGRLVRDVRGAFDAYDSQTACLKMEAFWDDLSTWYVRRNRSRFWKARSERDSLAAYQTLYEALTTLIRLFAPVMPFIAEEMFQNLVRRATKGAPASVHHATYPSFEASLIDDDLERRMRAARRVVDRPRRTVVGRREDEDATPEADRRVRRERSGSRSARHSFGAREIVKDELNVKAIEIRDAAEGLVKETVKPDLKVLGPEARKGAAARAPGARRGTIRAPRWDDHGRGLRARTPRSSSRMKARPATRSDATPAPPSRSRRRSRPSSTRRARS